ncbi:MAG: hypothetical protein AB7G93_01610 [Bdellovibrionales bacterium]
MKNRIYFAFLVSAATFVMQAQAYELYRCIPPENQEIQREILGYTVEAIRVDSSGFVTVRTDMCVDEADNLTPKSESCTTLEVRIAAQVARLGDVSANDDREENFFWAGETYDVNVTKEHKVRALYDPIPYFLALEQDTAFEGSCFTTLEGVEPR